MDLPYLPEPPESGSPNQDFSDDLQSMREYDLYDRITTLGTAGVIVAGTIAMEGAGSIGNVDTTLVTYPSILAASGIAYGNIRERIGAQRVFELPQDRSAAVKKLRRGAVLCSLAIASITTVTEGINQIADATDTTEIVGDLPILTGKGNSVPETAEHIAGALAFGGLAFLSDAMASERRRRLVR